eukprot:TRINITY_DN111206_c0_g1_i1.p1 TRINITY_DN111206_c0_g1~~TRINITY_DN111206_c0_g1_i1.p1  ORF type:complete len:319 (-),score=54.37 TRINITY_DN111206_c0_g1_i1:15-971(-)
MSCVTSLGQQRRITCLSRRKKSGRGGLQENAKVQQPASGQATVISSHVSDEWTGTVAATRVAGPARCSHGAVTPDMNLNADDVAMLAGQLRELMQLRQLNEQLRQHNELMAKLWQAQEQILEAGTESEELASVELAPPSHSRASTEFVESSLLAFSRASTEFEELADAKFDPVAYPRPSTELEEPAAVKFARLPCPRASSAPLYRARAWASFEELADVKFGPKAQSQAIGDFEEVAAMYFAPSTSSRASSDFGALAARKLGPLTSVQGARMARGIADSTEADMAKERENISASRSKTPLSMRRVHRGSPHVSVKISPC